MKKTIIILILVILLVVLFTACNIAGTDLRSAKADNTYNIAYYKLKDNCYLYIQIQEAKFIVDTNSIEVIDVDGNKIILPATETILMHKEAPTPDPRLPDVCSNCGKHNIYYQLIYSTSIGKVVWEERCNDCNWTFNTGISYEY